jgi:hypothetical protein
MIYKVQLTDSVLPGSPVVHFGSRSIRRGETVEIEMEPETAFLAAQDGYSLEPCPLEARRKEAEARARPRRKKTTAKRAATKKKEA